MFCGNCGKEVPNDAKFCNHCGAFQNNTSAQTDRTPQQTYTSDREKKSSASKSGVRGKIQIVLVVVAMVIAATIMAYGGDIFDRQPTSDPQGSTTLQNTHQESKEPQGLDEETFPFYALLSDKKRVVYEETLACIEKVESRFVPSYEFDKATINTILKYIAYDQPQLFWFEPNKTILNFNDSTGNVSEIEPGYNSLADDLEYNKKLIEEVTEPLLSEAAGLSDIEAERLFHDYICRNTAYLPGTYDQNIYSVFIEKKTVCAGYTHALQYLMMQRDVPCYFCVGTLYDVKEQDWVYHSWNIINLNGNYYNCDLTWDDFYNEADQYPSYISYEHFNTSDAQYILEVENNLGRLRTGDGILLPACNADDMNYQALYGTEWENDVIGQLGLDADYIIDSVDSFFDFLYNQAITGGIGNYSLTFIVRGRDTIERIDNLSNDEYLYHLIDPVADYIGRSGWSGMNWSYQYYPLWPYDEYVYMEFQLDFY